MGSTVGSFASLQGLHAAPEVAAAAALEMALDCFRFRKPQSVQKVVSFQPKGERGPAQVL